MFTVALYLIAIVLANLSVAAFGPSVSVLNAFLFIGLDLTARDALHERWKHRHLFAKMFALIGVGSVLSYVLNRSAGPIALASFVAFASAGVVDALVYHFLRGRFTTRLQRVNGSNVASAAVDSVVFPVLAFGSFLPWIIAGQFVAKVLGGFLWSLVLVRRTNARND